LDATANAYGTTAEVFRMGHAMMLEHDWQKVADRILEWLEETLPSQTDAARRKGVEPAITQVWENPSARYLYCVE
jgi:hypothetical protein